MDFQTFLNKIPKKFDQKEEALLKKAFNLAHEAHNGQRRFSGEPYVDHPLEAAIILGSIFQDATTIAATMLHDVPEDTKTTLEQVSKQFGSEVASLVDGVTKLGHVRLRNSTDKYYVENLRKMFVATSKDMRVILIKLADRLHNMRTLEFVKQDKQIRIAQETLEIFAPLASRLGIGEWKDELEDLAFKVVYPKEFEETKKVRDEVLEGREAAAKELQKELSSVLRTEGVRFIEITGRTKRLYSLFKKLRKYEGDIGRIYDLIALRVITKSTADCYAALGAIHNHFQPLPGRVKDFIALPKPNGYRSLHTTVFDHTGNVFEIQIRTDQMHDQAERGFASHWVYEEHAKSDNIPAAAALGNAGWVRDLQAIHEIQNPDDYLNALKIDFFHNRIFVLTPKGDVKELPEGATPIDFAFSVHSDLGFFMQGAKVNGKIVKLDYQLQSGEVVQIIKSKKPVNISDDWLKHVKTSNARSKIRQHLAENGGGIVGRIKKLVTRN